MRVLVTGGGGFLGSRIVRQLLDRGHDVVIAARSDYPQVRAWGVEQVQGDLAEDGVAMRATARCDAVVHTAAKAGVWGDRDDYHRSNVVATARILEACRENGIDALVYTSTPSVTFDGTDHENAGPDLPYATTFRTHYSATKAEGEKLVLAARDIKTVALRPHLIWGPGDPFIFPGVIERHKAGKLARIGKGANKVDITYVDNAAAAHVAALDALRGANPPAGKPFFVSDGEPIELWRFLDELFVALDLPRLKLKVPAGVAFAAGGMLETAHRAFGIRSEPRMTRFLAQQVSTSHWYDMGPARRELGYEPVVPRPEALRRTIADLRDRGLCGSAPHG